MTLIALSYRGRQQLDVWLVLLQKEFTSRYKRSLIGYAWSVLNPLAFTFVLWIAFKGILRFDTPHFALFLASGFFLWHSFSNSAVIGSSIFLSNASLLKKVRFQRWILVAAFVANEMVHLSLALPILLGLMIFSDVPLHWTLLWALPLVLLTQICICLPIALLTASLNAVFRDLERLVGIGVQFLFYLTPIVYPLALIGESRRQLALMNPMACQVINLRSVIMDGTFSWEVYGYGMTGALLLAGLSMLVYRRVVRVLPEVL